MNITVLGFFSIIFWEWHALFPEPLFVSSWPNLLNNLRIPSLGSHVLPGRRGLGLPRTVAVVRGRRSPPRGRKGGAAAGLGTARHRAPPQITTTAGARR